MESMEIEGAASYEHLDLGAVGRIVRDCVSVMLDTRSKTGERRTYRSVVDEINNFLEGSTDLPFTAEKHLTEDALRTFVSRDYINRVNINNNTVKGLYVFFLRNYKCLDGPVQAIITQDDNWKLLLGKTVENQHNDETHTFNARQLSAQMVCSWFRFNDHEISRILAKISNQYIMLRKSTRDENVIVKSWLSISLDQQKDSLKAVHRHIDRQGVPRQSVGFVMSVVRNIHIILQVEDAEGLEVISLREPVQTDFMKLMGFIQSMNIKRDLVSARVVVEREDDVWKKLPARFVLSDLDEYPDRQELIHELLDKKTCRTISDVQLRTDDDHSGGWSP